MKMSRRKLREIIFLLLFRIEFHTRSELEDQVDMYLSSLEDIEEKDYLYIHGKVNSILDQLPENDQKIRDICEGWDLKRLGKAELAIMRLAVYEMITDPDIPVSVAINEAVELAKKYCSEEAPRFINGVLAKLA